MSFTVLVKSYKTAVQQRLGKGQCKNTNFQPISETAYSSSTFQEDEKLIMREIIRIKMRLFILFFDVKVISYSDLSIASNLCLQGERSLSSHQELLDNKMSMNKHAEMIIKKSTQPKVRLTL